MGKTGREIEEIKWRIQGHHSGAGRRSCPLKSIRAKAGRI
ncbi:MAG: hypothetical protein K6A30_04765 [Lachnospiraceae bacterium]|nr:hypothetical protein [Lachnospiraceae bacterium]